MQSDPGFSGIRKYLWPIYTNELVKVLPMVFMFWGIVFNYSILRQIKDAQVLTFGEIGGPIILYLKMAVFASAIAFTLFFAQLSKWYNRHTLFYGLVSAFLLFFVAFALIIFPNRQIFMLTGLSSFLGKIFYWNWARGLVAAVKHWDLSLFYVVAELWGSVALSLLFWGFANSVSSTDDSKRYYAALAVGGNLATIVAGKTLKWLASRSLQQALLLGLQQNSPEAWLPTLRGAVLLVSLHGMVVLGCYFFLTHVCGIEASESSASAKKRLKLGVLDSLKIIAESPLVRYLSVLVLSYGLCINLVEVMWKDHVTRYFGGGNAQAAFIGDSLAYTGAVTVFFGLFVSHNILRMFTWTTTALITPLLLGGTGLMFMAVVIINNFKPEILIDIGWNPLYIVVLLGAIQNILSKSIKYALFDPTKEMVFIYSGDETIRTVGKAVVDVTFARAGKFLGSPIQLVFLALFGTLSDSSIGLGFTLAVIVWFWCSSVSQLGVLIAAREKEMIMAEDAEMGSKKAGISAGG